MMTTGSLLPSKTPSEKRKKGLIRLPKLTFKRRNEIFSRIQATSDQCKKIGYPPETAQADRHILWNKLADVEAENTFLREQIRELQDWKEKVEGASALMSELRRLRDQLLEKNKLIREYRLGLKAPRGFKLVKKVKNKLTY